MLFLFIGISSHAQQVTINGTVSDEDGPLPGASVIIKGSSQGVDTDFDGKFNIDANKGDILVFSYVGKIPQEITIEDQTTLVISLQNNNNILNEVVVTGYSSRKRSELASAVSTVGVKEIERQNRSSSIDKSLQGTAPGVTVTAQNGRPGNAAFVRVRGVGSMNAGNEPLYLLDGVQVDENDVIGINPADIISINILKDAASTAIYGARGSNGVIVITTKSGGKGKKTTFNFSARYGVGQEVKRNFRVMNAQEKLEYERAIGVGVGSQITSPSDWNQLISQDHDWDEDLTKENKISSVNFNMSGGGEKTTYFLSISNDKETGIVELIDDAFERTAVRLNTSFQALKWMNITTKLAYSNSKTNTPRDRNNIQNPFVGRFVYNPYEPVYSYDSNGEIEENLRGLPKYNPTHQGLSSLAQIRGNINETTTDRWFGTIKVDFDIADGLVYTPILNTSYIQNSNTIISHAGSALDMILFGTPTGETSLYQANSFSYNFTNKLTYSKIFADKHNVRLTGLTEFYENQSEDIATGATGYIINGPTTVDAGANPSPSRIGGNRSSNGYVSFAISGDYVFDNRIIGSLTFRRDGSSRFGSETKYANFWGASLGWNMHNENFFKNLSKTINYLKPRISTGTSGNDRIGIYESKTLYGYTAYNGNIASVPTTFGDPNLGWEKSFTYGAAVEYGLFNGRVNGVIEYYKRTTSDLLLDTQFSLTQGGGTITTNLGEIENSGWEFSLNGDIVRNENWTWNVGGMFSLYDNKVNKLKGDGEDVFTSQNFYTGQRVGEEVNTFYLPRYVGVNPANGQALFLDQNDNITTSIDNASVFLSGKSPNAKFDGSITTSLTYKNVFFDMDFYFRGGNYIFNTVEQQLLSDGTKAISNQRVDAWNYWKEPGDTNVLPDPTANNPYRNDANGDSDRFLQRGDFIRLRNVRLGYNIPEKLISKTPIDQIKVYGIGTNLWTYAPWFVGDPEVGISSEETAGTRGIIPGEFTLNSYPTLSSITFGIDIQF